jgi:methylated-DNA-[protein]-cysteine S-methyltransferase
VSEVFTSIIVSPIGPLRIRVGEKGIVALDFVDEATARRGEAASPPPGMPEVLRTARKELDEYFRGSRASFSAPIDLTGTPFQRRVWEVLLRIPYGQTMSYKEVAAAVGNGSATRAVGGANHRNPVSIIVPCHRVVGCDGRLTGYGGGLWRKEWLLDHEKRHSRDAKGARAWLKR